MPRGVTVRAIAARSGVSIATVSRVLNDRANVAPDTRELVRRTVEELGAQARARAVRESAGRVIQGAVYLRCPYLLADYFGVIVSSIAETLELHGRTLILNGGEAAQREAVLPTLPLRPGIGGAIVILPPEPSEDLLALRDRGFPFVVVDPRIRPPRDIAAVSAAHFAGARSMTAHLVELGHRRIGVIAGPHNWMAGQARLAGHASALSDAGVLPSPELIRPAHPAAAGGYKVATQLLDLPEPPTALIAFNDKAAVGALAAATSRGLSVPGDLSIAGFDDIDLAQATTPMLTTVRQPLAEMGRMAVSLLIRLMDGHKVDALHVELATELVIRGSTGPVPALVSAGASTSAARNSLG